MLAFQGVCNSGSGDRNNTGFRQKSFASVVIAAFEGFESSSVGPINMRPCVQSVGFYVGLGGLITRGSQREEDDEDD